MLLMLDPSTGDLALSGGTLVWGATLPEEVAQRLRSRFRFFKGEWFLDRREGFPWYQRILGQRPSNRAIRTLFTRVIVGTPGIASLLTLDFSRDNERNLSLVFTARLTDGSTFDSSNFGPFLVEV
jgi:hypothetical protein